MSEEPRFAPNGNRLPERLPVGHRLVDTAKQQWLIGPSIGCGGFGDIYLTRQFSEEREDLKRFTQDQIIKESDCWTNVIKFEHFSGPLFAEINFYLRCARKETVEEYMTAKKMKHLGMPRFVASGIYDPLRGDNPPPVCKNTVSLVTDAKPPAAKRGRKTTATDAKKINGVVANGRQKRIPASAQSKEKKYRFLVLQRFGDDVQKIWTRANEHFDMKSAFNIALKVIDTLEYIHSHGYVHADVKASNLLVDWRQGHNSTRDPKNLINGSTNNQSSADSGNGSLEESSKRYSRSTSRTKATKRPQNQSSNRQKTNDTTSNDKKSSIEPDDQIYLVDFGLVERFYSKDGTHRDHVEDQRRANNGTVEFSSRDAHIGAFSRRSDLESLAYNLLYWVSGGRLPWTNVLKDHQLVEASKKWYMDNLEIFVNYCFNEDAYPIDPLKVLRGADPSTIVHSSASSIQINSNGRANGRATHCSNNNGSAVSTTSTKASTTSSKPSVKSRASSSKSSSSTTSAHDSIMCAALYDFLSYITKLGFADEPDYCILKSILSNALGGGSSARMARKRGGLSLKKTPPKSAKCENPTPAMREILRKMKLSSKKR